MAISMISGYSERIVDVEERKCGVKHADHDDNGADRAIDDEHAPESERMLHLCDEIREENPPQHRAREDR